MNKRSEQEWLSLFQQIFNRHSTYGQPFTAFWEIGLIYNGLINAL